MVHLTRRGSRGPRHARAAFASLALLLALAVAAWSVQAGLQAQQPPPGGPNGGSQPGPIAPGAQPAPPGVEVQPVPPDLPPVIIPQPNIDPPALPPGGFDGPRPPQRFSFTIDPTTPLKDLLPTPPKAKAPSRRGPAADLASVPELDFQAALAKNAAQEEPAQRTAHMLAKINFLNGKKPDGFLQALRADRSDLDGLPFAMGDACRTRGERSRQFTLAVTSLRQALQTAAAAQDPNTGQPAGEHQRAASFWEQYEALCIQQDRGASQIDRDRREDVALTRVAALMQVLAPETPDMRLKLVQHLSGVPQAEATRALARLAIFSAEEEVRKAAVEALQVRRERDYTDVLVKGLHYPWPAVAQRSAEAVAKLERTDLAPLLVSMLDDPDPRSPVSQQIDDKPALVVHEMVRINHHRNCLLCHSPGNTDGVSQEALKAPIPLPNEQLGSPANGYQSSTPELLVRIDVTYLRQDFSLLQPVEDANPWPEMQRFDFLVRTRTVTDEEAKAFREKLDKREAGRPSPYQRAALSALRDLTGKDAAPTAEAWRKILEQSAGQR